MPRFPSYRDPEEFQLEVCDFCGNRTPRRLLRTLEIEGMRGREACNYCLQNGLSLPGYRDYRAFRGRPSPRLTPRLPPYGASGWIEEIDELLEEG